LGPRASGWTIGEGEFRTGNSQKQPYHGDQRGGRRLPVVAVVHAVKRNGPVTIENIGWQIDNFHKLVPQPSSSKSGRAGRLLHATATNQAHVTAFRGRGNSHLRRPGSLGILSLVSIPVFPHWRSFSKRTNTLTRMQRLWPRENGRVTPTSRLARILKLIHLSAIFPASVASQSRVSIVTISVVRHVAEGVDR
jgi:hypothetical protein